MLERRSLTEATRAAILPAMPLICHVMANTMRHADAARGDDAPRAVDMRRRWHVTRDDTILRRAEWRRRAGTATKDVLSRRPRAPVYDG